MFLSVTSWCDAFKFQSSYCLCQVRITLRLFALGNQIGMPCHRQHGCKICFVTK